MKQNTIIWTAVVVVVVALGIWYFTSLSSAPGTGSSTATTSTPADTGTQVKPAAVKPAGSSTFRSIFTQTGNYQCSYASVESSAQIRSVIYIADGKMRGEFRTTGANASANLMIYTGGYLYSWKEGSTTGTKSSIKTLADLPSVIPQDLTSGAILGVSSDNVSWDCHDWAKDVKLFSLPTYVTFSTR